MALRVLLALVLGSCVAGRTLAPPGQGMLCDGDRDRDGRVIWWDGKLDYTCTSRNSADAGARMDVYRRGETDWVHMGGDGSVPRLVRPGEEDLSSLNLTGDPGATILLVATFLDAAGRATDVETVLLRPDPADPCGWLAP